VTTWFDDPHRSTRDLDLLGFGDPDPDAVLSAFREICAIKVDEVVTFDVEGATIERIRDQAQYGGLRIKSYAFVDGARVRVVVDIGFGDAVEPGLAETELPVLLDFPAPRLRTYVRETVIAEKFEAIVVLGRANSRMKDLYDIWLLSQTYEFKDDKLSGAIAATFERRGTEIPEKIPDCLTRAFAEDPLKLQQWSAFTDTVKIKPGPLAKVVDDLAAFLMPHARAGRKLASDKT
jgi:Nucleotidyl transferase AbiEii toxin, Type IV TA system